MIPENYPLHVPKGSGNQLVAAMQLIPANHLDAWRMHRVGTGETLATIGKRYNVTPANIVSVNHLESAQAVEGDRLLIPSVQRVQAPAPKKTLTATARRKAPAHRKTATTASARPVRKSPGSARPQRHQLISFAGPALQRSCTCLLCASSAFSAPLR